MDPIEEQKAVLEEIYWVIRDASPAGCDTATCIIEFGVSPNGHFSVDSRVSYDIGGTTKHDIFDDDGLDVLDRTVPKLHALMKEHTGGAWSGFSMTVDKDGKLSTKFDYPKSA